MRPFTLLLLGLFLFAGCGDGGRPYHRVQGVVKFKQDDSVARFGTIEFRSESEPVVTARAMIQRDGTFSLKSGVRQGAAAGWHTVVIIQSVTKNLHGKVKHDHGHEAAKKYLDHRTTDLRIEVTEESRYEELDLIIDAAKN